MIKRIDSKTGKEITVKSDTIFTQNPCDHVVTGFYEVLHNILGVMPKNVKIDVERNPLTNLTKIKIWNDGTMPTMKEFARFHIVGRSNSRNAGIGSCGVGIYAALSAMRRKPNFIADMSFTVVKNGEKRTIWITADGSNERFNHKYSDIETCNEADHAEIEIEGVSVSDKELEKIHALIEIMLFEYLKRHPNFNTWTLNGEPIDKTVSWDYMLHTQGKNEYADTFDITYFGCKISAKFRVSDVLDYIKPGTKLNDNVNQWDKIHKGGDMCYGPMLCVNSIVVTVGGKSAWVIVGADKDKHNIYNGIKIVIHLDGMNKRAIKEMFRQSAQKSTMYVNLAELVDEDGVTHPFAEFVSQINYWADKFVNDVPRRGELTSKQKEDIFEKFVATEEFDKLCEEIDKVPEEYAEALESRKISTIKKRRDEKIAGQYSKVD